MSYILFRVVAIGAFLLVTVPAIAGRTFEFTFTSAQSQRIGSFTMTEDNLFAHINNPFPGYVPNTWISDLNFSYNGSTWLKSSIATSDQTSFDVSGALPQVTGGNGYLAFSNLTNTGITIFHPSVGTSFGYPIAPALQGVWSTSVVPEPGAAVLFSTGLAGLLGYRLVGRSRVRR